MNEEKLPDQESVKKPESNNEKKLTRGLFKKRKNKQKDEEQHEEKSVRWVQIRLIPIWLRVIFVLLTLAAIALVGLYIGYGIIGDGEPKDIFKKETWTHITDIIQGIE